MLKALAFTLLLTIAPIQTLADSRAALTLTGTWELQALQADPVTGSVWVTRDSGLIARGGAFVQFQAPPLSQARGCSLLPPSSSPCLRLKIAAAKPIDQPATFAVQAPSATPSDPTRTFRVTAPIGQAQAVLYLSEISLEDLGQVALQLVVQGGTSAAYGLIDLRTYDTPPVTSAQVAVVAKGTLLENGAKIQAGWWVLFMGSAPSLEASEDASDLLSLCVQEPDKSPTCVSDLSSPSLRFHVTRKGVYEFTAWNKELSVNTFQVTAL